MEIALFKHLIPDKMFDSVLQITPKYLINENINCVLVDIDNTLITYGEKYPTKKLLTWFSDLENNGIKIAFISNNSEKRVKIFNSLCGFAYESRAKKPSKKGALKLMKELKAKKENTCMIGDQIFTDVLCARNAGIRAIMVRTLETNGKPFLKFKKLVERPFEKYYRKKEDKT